MKNYRMFTVKYIGASNTKGSRVKIVDTRFKKSVTVSYDHKFNRAADIGLDYLVKRGITISGESEDETTNLHHFFTDNFDTQIK